ncbi:RPC7 family DNA-directed RNA polymerase III subunit [Nocardia beijingensis]|uniref:RPC7 family DNA-directed RNA polymerase III subunit n=1 Tax=Nocardia beijingensis TaxID=95162 RepID=A0ABW7WD84_9NOCA
MKGGGRIALGVGIGYLLGRTRKMRFALSLAGAAMARRSAGGPGDLIGRGTELLKSTPELTRITDTVRDELLGAARAAAVTAASNRIDALSNRLQQGATLLADQDRGGSRAGADEDEYDQESDEYEEEAPEDEDEEQAPEDEYEDEDQGPEEEDEDQAPEDEYEDENEAPEDQDRAPDDELEGEDEDQASDEEDAEEDDAERPAARGRARRSSTAAKRGAGSRTADRSSDSTDRKPSGTRARRTRAEAGQAPVRRTRR